MGTWRSHGISNSSLIDALMSNGVLKNSRVAAALKLVDRAKYVPSHAIGDAYKDHPVGIGYGATISAPHMHAYTLELLEKNLQHGARVLDVGSGSGYLVSCMYHLVAGHDKEIKGKVVGIEHINELTEISKKNIMADQPNVLSRGHVIVKTGDGREGDPENAPFDAIHVGAAAPTIPDALIEQLSPGGRLVIPVGPEGHDQELIVVDKDNDGTIHKREVMGVVYVPLCDKKHQGSGSSSFALDDEVLSALITETGLSSKEIKRIHKHFIELCYIESDNTIGKDVASTKDHKHTHKLLSDARLSADRFFALPENTLNPLRERMRYFFHRESGGKLPFEVFISLLMQYSAHTTFSIKMRRTFDLFDIDGDGYVSSEEVFRILKMILGCSLTDVHIQSIVNGAFLRIPTQNDGDRHDGSNSTLLKMNFDQFNALISPEEVQRKMVLRF